MTEKMRTALDWYRGETEALNRHLEAKNDDAIEACVTVLGLDAGRRARKALEPQSTVDRLKEACDLADSVLRNIAPGDKKELERWTDEIAELVGLADRLQRKASRVNAERVLQESH